MDVVTRQDRRSGAIADEALTQADPDDFEAGGARGGLLGGWLRYRCRPRIQLVEGPHDPDPEARAAASIWKRSRHSRIIGARRLQPYATQFRLEAALEASGHVFGITGEFEVQQAADAAVLSSRHAFELDFAASR